MTHARLLRHTRRATRAAVVTAAAVLLASGCSSDPDLAAESPVSPAEDIPPLEERLVDTPLLEAASDEQLALLEDGKVTFEEYEAAVGWSLACLEDAGFDVRGPTQSDRRGFVELSYSFSATTPGLDEDQSLAVADACLEEHSMAVEMAYQTGPVAVEGQDALFEDKREPLIACIKEHGVDVDEDATRDEAERAAIDVLLSEGADCFNEAGFPR